MSDDKNCCEGGFYYLKKKRARKKFLIELIKESRLTYISLMYGTNKRIEWAISMTSPLELIKICSVSSYGIFKACFNCANAAGCILLMAELKDSP